MFRISKEFLPVPGFRAAGVSCGIKSGGALDVALLASQYPQSTLTAACFTQNKLCAAPVTVGRQLMESHSNSSAMRLPGVVVNAGCANACTGEQGLSNAREMSELLASSSGGDGFEMERFLPCSTGVIGEHLQMDKIRRGVAEAQRALTESSQGFEAASRAIMTTDTRPKYLHSLDEQTGVQMAGMIKGSGMIHPNMATMLCFLMTDADFNQQAHLQRALGYSVDRSFNCASIDGDTSTNDTVVLLANGQRKVTDEARFQLQLTDLCVGLAKEMVRDGEGITKFITLTVSDASSYEDAKLAARTVQTSLLTKTALFGEDANWGRIMAAAGRSGAQLNPQEASLSMSSPKTGKSVTIFDRGAPMGASEELMTEIISEDEVDFHVGLGMGSGDKVEPCVAWFTDLSYEYVKINGDYRS